MSSLKKANGSTTVTQYQQLFISWTMFLLTDIIVLNLWVEFADAVVIDSFIISILAAVVMRALLAGTFRIEHRVAAVFDSRPGIVSKALRILTAWIILFLSKFVILEILDIIFGDHVELGGLITFIALVITLVAAEALIDFIYGRLGESQHS